MVTAQNLLYSVAAARRILGIYYPEIKVTIQVWAKVILVISDGRRPRFISKKVFQQHFVDWRKQQAQSLVVEQDTLLRRKFRAINFKKGSTYTVGAYSDVICCECEDYKNQMRFWDKAMCKHSFAVLNYMGYNSLSQFLSRDRALPL